MKYLLLLLVLLSTNAMAAVCWEAPITREDNTAITIEEIGGYIIFLSDTKGGPYQDIVTINDGMLKCYDYQTLTNKYAVMKTVDSEGRNSQYSNEVFIAATETIPTLSPSTVSQFSVTKDSDSNNYTFAWLAPSTFDDGVTPLPVDAISKFYLFDNGAWVQDIQSSENSLYKTLTPGDHLFEMEAEILTADGKYIASKRSAMVAVEVVTPPKAPHTIKYTLPDGYRAVEITITPIN